MPRVFTANVLLRDPATSENRVFMIGEEVPEEFENAVGGHVATSQGVSREVQKPASLPAGDDNAGDKTVVTDESDESEEELDSYHDLSKGDLLIEAKGRELEIPSKATKDDLVALLEADDAANPVED